MKIIGYLISGSALIRDIESWTDDQLNGSASVKLSDTIDTGYDDISSITIWSRYGRPLGKDYTYVRAEIATLLAGTTFASLSLDEQKIVSQYYLVSKADRDTVHTEEEQKSNWNILVELSQQSRYNRWAAAKSIISYTLAPADSADLAQSTATLCNNYIDYNITSYAATGQDGLFDYLKGEAAYSGSGYPSKSYWTQQDEDDLMDILENGNY